MKYNLNIIRYKESRRFDKIKEKDIYKRSLKSAQMYSNINFNMALFLVNKEDCKIRFLDKKGEVTTKDKAYSAYAYSHYGVKVFAIITRVIKTHFNSPSDLSIHPQNPKSISINNKFIKWEEIHKLTQFHEENFFDYSLEAFTIWGPQELIPRGFHHVKEGVVEKDDYYFDTDHWVKCYASFSPIKIGAKIEKKKILYKGKHPGRIENDTLNIYNEFIIRKNG